MGVNDLHAAASEYLAACVAALDSLTDEGAPSYRFVSHGPPAWDCPPMLTVHTGFPQVASTAIGGAALAPGHRIVLTGVVNMVALTATILRCAPSTADGDAPAAAAQTDFAATTNADLWAIWNWLVARKHDGSLFGGNCRELILDTASALSIQGLAGGWQIPLRVELDGFAPEA